MEWVYQCQVRQGNGLFWSPLCVRTRNRLLYQHLFGIFDLDTRHANKSLTSGELQLPHVLVMDNSNVTYLGDIEKLAKMCGHIVELDLANNSLASWSDMLQLLNRLPQLRLLNLSINPMLGPKSDSVTHEEKTDAPEKPLKDSECHSQCLVAQPMPHLSTLALNQLPQLSWPMLAGLLSSAPNLTELYLSNNDMEAPDFPCPKIGGYASVQQLYFNGNRLLSEDWTKLSQWFPKLEKLTLIGNSADKLPSSAVSLATEEGSNNTNKDSVVILPLLCNLKSLNLSESEIDSWSELEKLNLCPSLTDLRILDIKFGKGRPKKEFRAEAIARLAHVTHLNGTAVTDEERSAAERSLIRAHTIDLEIKNEPTDLAVAEAPDQLDSLLAKHGRLDALAKVDLRPTQSVSLVLRYGNQSRTCQLATNQLIREVKQKVCAQFNVEPSRVGLYYIDQGMVGAMGPELLNLPGRAFHSYRPEDGDELILKDFN
ncbi:hypothetical protein BOX15_Mlig027535g1 [Macrostomum lignano]|uniref:Ubiquitin-like domain-containing protein n=1 Tax=Macrostomum lignano TaxID=282301 RepID=A0A267ESI6_9PLAT|nr:hypothetical protein BOX15_Mlig027535g1 [Macrostomum lignano]